MIYSYKYLKLELIVCVLCFCCINKKNSNKLTKDIIHIAGKSQNDKKVNKENFFFIKKDMQLTSKDKNSITLPQLIDDLKSYSKSKKNYIFHIGNKKFKLIAYLDHGWIFDSYKIEILSEPKKYFCLKTIRNDFLKPLNDDIINKEIKLYNEFAKSDLKKYTVKAAIVSLNNKKRSFVILKDYVEGYTMKNLIENTKTKNDIKLLINALIQVFKIITDISDKKILILDPSFTNLFYSSSNKKVYLIDGFINFQKKPIKDILKINIGCLINLSNYQVNAITRNKNRLIPASKFLSFLGYDIYGVIQNTFINLPFKLNDLLNVGLPQLIIKEKKTKLILNKFCLILDKIFINSENFMKKNTNFCDYNKIKNLFLEEIKKLKLYKI